MGDFNQLLFIKNNSNLILGPILEIGSKIYENSNNYRKLFPKYEFIGIDIEKGEGVDLVLDFTKDFEIINEKLLFRRFKTVICLSVLEHCKDPFKMCRNISKIMETNGYLFISIPFSWRIHAYPYDFWRFTPAAINLLFPDFDFNNDFNTISTDIIGKFQPIDSNMACIDFIQKVKSDKWKDSIKNKLILIFKKLKIFKSIFSHYYVFPPIMINMIGRKREQVNQ